MSNIIGNFISNNVIKGIRSSEKRLKNNKHHNDFVFLQETHSLSQDEKKQKDDFKYLLLFSHGSTNSCGVAIGFCGLKSLHITNRKSDQNGQILIIDAKVNDEKFLLVNLHNSNTKSEQADTLDTFKRYIYIYIYIYYIIILCGDLNLVFD